jgi:hypothetical protein
MVGLFMVAELEEILKEAVVAYSRYQSWNSPITTEKSNEEPQPEQLITRQRFERGIF